ncbi:MAG TPA: DUF222 domain-containing protein [Acidimicrobiales bacterium]|nr:DUF222 domain-containing protein [Acidimicrobiales bacterium]
MGIEELAAAIDDLLAEGVDAHCDADSMTALIRQHSRLESVVSTAAGAYDASGDWAADGARTATAWLARRCRLPRAAARRVVRRGRQLRHLPVVAEAFAEGEINAAHLDAVVAVRRPGSEEALARDEALLVKQAKRLRFEQFAKAVAYWDQLADPDGSEEAAEERRARRDVYLEASINGMYLGSMTLDPISGSIVAGELGRIEDEFFRADWARARAERGGNPTPDDLWRTPAQRRADALVEMAARSSIVQPDGVRRPPAPLFSVLVDWPTLSGRVCELAEGIVVSPGELVPWLSVADLERAVMEPSGRVEVSPTRRLFTGGTRRAIELRDRECVHAYCDVPGWRCQADHILPWARSGRTIQENGRLLCGFHNRLRNQRPPPQRE